MSSKHDRFAIAASGRVNPQVVGIGSGIISAILAAIVPVLLEQLTNCLAPKSRKNPTPEALRAKLASAYNKDPKAVREQAAKEAMKEARKQGERINKEQAYAIGDAAIHEGLQTPELDWSL